ncbi:DUF3048 domain-containing protein [Patescibacteria group bacterium]|nr:DUF3048 domain-containing protein [Patescibacteria group bacterium]MBU1028928.1 DUF3048 domain-containing protein [Patescibacteria group bacterium]MBU1915776.1 DUF3048 domain-containing protein [Patescibacteria group bacterium]
MSNPDIKTARRQTEASRRAVFDLSTEFWAGPPGWVLVLLMTAIGVAAIIFSYYQGFDSRYGETSLSSQTESSAIGSPSDVSGGLVLDGFRSSIDGILLSADNWWKYFAVVIDNYTESRPAAGITAAPLVIESPVEGGITRLLVIFSDSFDLRRIGPVRSARPYFVEWSQEYGAVLVHVGGSPLALKMLAGSGRYRHVNEMSWGGYFWRDRQRSAPHNVYTSADLLNQSLKEFGEFNWSGDNDRPFKQGGSEGRPAGEPLITKLTIDYSVSNYFVVWDYDQTDNIYKRYQGGGLVRDENGQAVSADNVIVQYTDIKTIDSIGRKDIRTIGTGEALVMRDGRVIKARWLKEGTGRTRFLFPDSNEEIPLNVGTTWIQVVAENTPVEY